MSGTVVFIIVLSILLILAIVAVVIIDISNKKIQNTQIYQFSGIWPGTGDGSLPPAGSTIESGGGQGQSGQPQIKCPNGSKVRILSATYQPYDPNQVCDINGTTNQTYIDSCASPTATGYDPVLCFGYNPSTKQNPACTDCVIRDATYFVSQICNGTETCNVNMADTSQVGPFPCPSGTNMASLPQSGTGSNILSGYYLHGLYTCEIDD